MAKSIKSVFEKISLNLFTYVNGKLDPRAAKNV